MAANYTSCDPPRITVNNPRNCAYCRTKHTETNCPNCGAADTALVSPEKPKTKTVPVYQDLAVCVNGQVFTQRVFVKYKEVVIPK